MISNTEDFLKLFDLSESEEITRWKEDGESVGFSIIKNYPDGIKFSVARNKDGKADTIMLIKVGFDSREIKDGKAFIFAYIYSASRYLLDQTHWDYNFNDDDSPTEGSLREKDKSKKPLDLEERDRYVLEINNGNIFDNEKNKYVNGHEVIEILIENHLHSIGAWFSKFKIYITQKLSLTEAPIKVGKRVLEVLFGRILKPSEAWRGIIYPYKSEDLIPLKSINNIKIFGTELPITNQTGITAAAIIFMTAILTLVWKSAFNGVSIFINHISQNTLYQISIITIILLFLDRVVPKLIFYTINAWIRIRSWIGIHGRVRIEKPTIQKKLGYVLMFFVVVFICLYIFLSRIY